MRRQRGTTLIEILLSLAVVLVGMLALFRVLASSISSAALGTRMSQAQTRAVAILDAMRHSPGSATDAQATLNCLVNNPSTQWFAVCEPLCQTLLVQAGNLTAPLDACIFTTQRFNIVKSPDLTGVNANSNNGQAQDRNNQNYALDPRSKVVLGGPLGYPIYDVDVFIGWNDDGSANNTGDRAYHTLELRTGVKP